MSIGHHHHHHHGHSHGHGSHQHHEQSLGRIRFAFFLNFFFACFELVGGYWINSVAIMSDALHDFGDALALGSAYWLERKSMKKPDARFSYGYRRLSLLAATITGFILLAGSAFICFEAWKRLLNPEPVHALGMMAFAFVGLLVNGVSLLKLKGGSSQNEKMLAWHFIEDIAGWLAVLAGSVVLHFVDWPQIDSILAIGIALWISFNVFRQIFAIGSIFLQALPAGVELTDISQALAEIAGIKNSHHTHLWSLDGSEHVLTTHVCLTSASTPLELVQLKKKIRETMHSRFGIHEVTIEFEFPDETCADPEHK